MKQYIEAGEWRKTEIAYLHINEDHPPAFFCALPFFYMLFTLVLFLEQLNWVSVK